MGYKDDIIPGGDRSGNGLQIRLSGDRVIHPGNTDPAGTDCHIFHTVEQRRNAGIGHRFGKERPVLIVFSAV